MMLTPILRAFPRPLLPRASAFRRNACLPLLRAFACPRVMWSGALRRNACLPLLRHAFIPLLCSLAFLSAPSLASQDKIDSGAQSSTMRGSGIKFNSATANPALGQRNRAQGLHAFTMAGNANAADSGSANRAAPTLDKHRPARR